MKTFAVLSLSLLILAACGKKDGSSASDSMDAVESAIESGVTATDGVIDDQQGSSYAYYKKSSVLDLFTIPSAEAASCTRAVSMSCNSGVRSTTYSSCTGASALVDFNGTVSLTYSQPACTMNSNGDTVTRSYNVSITGPRGGVFTHSSSAHTNYLGASISGGGRLTKTSGGYGLDILGKNVSFTRNSRTLVDVSVHTSSQVSVLGSLARGSRTVDGGAIVVDHNLAGFSATLVPSNLGYSASCCYPTSGTLGVTYSGSKTGSASVTFTGCGSATVNSNGSSQDITLSYCE